MQCQPVDLDIMKFNDPNSLNIHFTVIDMIFLLAGYVQIEFFQEIK